MSAEYLQAEVVMLLTQSKLSRCAAALALDKALSEAYCGVERISYCPICEQPFTFIEPVSSYSVRIECPTCQKSCRVTCGTVRSKRANTSSELMTDLGLFVRFIDAASRERYAALHYFRTRVELRSKDLVSICVAEDGPVDDIFQSRDPGSASILNLTLNTKPYFGEIWGRAELLRLLQS